MSSDIDSMWKREEEERMRKVDEKLAELEARMDKKLAELEKRIDKKLANEGCGSFK
jgi:tetrahydromethanopterin S-methyltransferase subunit G